MNSLLTDELELIARKIELNTATLSDYQKYEHLLKIGGLSRDYIFSYLNKAGLNSWEDLLNARKSLEQKEIINAAVVGGIIGLGLGLLLNSLFGRK